MHSVRVMDTCQNDGPDWEAIARYNITKYSLVGVEPTGKQIGHGSQGSATEVRYKGLTCAAKRYKISRSASLMNGKCSVDEEEHCKWCYNLCHLLGQLRHPNIVQFLGFYHDTETVYPLLVFEMLHVSLEDCLDRYGVMPENISLSILKDVATAVRYLHERVIPIILHQSLCASKVLLTKDMTAKLSDVGVCCIADIGNQLLQKEAGQGGTGGKMVRFAPDIKLKNDIYFFGLLMLHVFTRRNPVAELTENLRLNRMGSITDADIVQTLMGEVQEKHPLFNILERTLDNIPLARPTIITIQQSITQVASNYPTLFGNALEMTQQIRREKDKQLTMQNKIKQLSPQNSQDTTRSGEVERLKSLLHKMSAQKMALQAQLDAKVNGSANCMLDSSGECMEVVEDGLNGSPSKVLRRQENHWIRNPIEMRQGHIHWTKLADLPVGMFQAQAVFLRKKIYIGGGNTGNVETDSLVFEYNFQTNSWKALPPMEAVFFGLCKLEGELIAVGGKMGTEATSAVFVFDSFTKRWKNSLPPMSEARYSPSCTSTQSGIIVIGGLSSRNELLSSIEVMKSDTFQWYTACYLSRSATLSHASTVVLHDTIYLMGGYQSSTASSYCNVAHSSPVDILLNYSGLIPRSWTPTPSTPHCQSTTACIGPCLMALGGTNIPYTLPVHRNMYGYCPMSETWVYVGELPYAFCHGTAVSLPNNEIIIMGGWVQPGKQKRSCAVYHGSVTR